MTHDITYFSISTGVGGVELGLQQASPAFHCVGFSEIDRFAGQVLAHRFPNVRNYGDATRIDRRELPDFDLLCGGFPCQAVSIAGKTVNVIEAIARKLAKVR